MSVREREGGRAAADQKGSNQTYGRARARVTETNETVMGGSEGSTDMSMMMMMPMYFTNSYKTTLWFKCWKSEG